MTLDYAYIWHFGADVLRGTEGELKLRFFSLCDKFFL